MSYKRRARKRRNRKARQRELVKRFLIFSVATLLLVLGGNWIKEIIKEKATNVLGTEVNSHINENEERPPMEVDLLNINPYSRPGSSLKKVKDIVIHYTANPNTSAMDNRNYFNGLKESKKTKASSHFIVGLEGEIVQCIPTKEIAYASNERNDDSLAIETCHVDETGKFNEKTYKSLVELTAWLCKKFELTSDNVIRHYDITKKMCPKYYVDHEDEWIKFKKEVQTTLDSMK